MLMVIRLWLGRSSSGTGEGQFICTNGSACVSIMLRLSHKAQHIAALLVPIWRVNEEGVVRL